MPTLATVRIKHGDGARVINAEDFDPETMVEVEDEPEETPEPEVPHDDDEGDEPEDYDRFLEAKVRDLPEMLVGLNENFLRELYDLESRPTAQKAIEEALEAK